MQLIKNLLTEEIGVSAIEYSLIAAFLAVIIAVSVASIGSALSTEFSTIAAAF